MLNFLKIYFLNSLPPSLSRAAYFRQTGGSKEKHYLMIHANKTFFESFREGNEYKIICGSYHLN